MASEGIRKAALLLMGLDQATAAELLRAASPEMVTEITAELSYLESAARSDVQLEQDPVREFVALISSGGGGGGRVKGLLTTALGADRSESVLADAQELLARRDPFLPVREAPVDQLAGALEGESPRVAALVLSELPARRAGELLSLLDEDVRPAAIRGMACAEGVGSEARLRVAETVRARLDAARAEGRQSEAAAAEARQKKLRKLAVVLRGLGQESRAPLLEALAEQDADTAQDVRKLMVTWEDVPKVSDRGMQEVLRGTDAGQLALALYEADPIVTEKIRTNMSERAAALLDEEASLLSKPKAEEIAQAREVILDALREVNETGALEFETDE